MNQLRKALTGVVAAAGFACSAHAAIVTQWQGVNTAEFTGATYTGSGDVSTSSSQLSWGAAALANRSSLTITNNAATLVNTYLGSGVPPAANTAVGSSLTHLNQVINGSTLLGATIKDTLTLTPTAPSGPLQALPSISFNIAFSETSNTANSNSCGFPSSSACDDIFVLLGGFFNQSFVYDTDGAGGDAPVTYFVNIFPIAGGVLSILDPLSCAQAGQPAGCFGFQTQENATTTLAFGYSVSTNPLSIPEPGTLALVGLALLGIGKSRRLARR